MLPNLSRLALLASKGGSSNSIKASLLTQLGSTPTGDRFFAKLPDSFNTPEATVISAWRRQRLPSVGPQALEEATAITSEASASEDGTLIKSEVAGGRKPLMTWEKWYWGVCVVGISVFGLTWFNRRVNKEDDEVSN